MSEHILSDSETKWALGEHPEGVRIVPNTWLGRRLAHDYRTVLLRPLYVVWVFAAALALTAVLARRDTLVTVAAWVNITATGLLIMYLGAVAILRSVFTRVWRIEMAPPYARTGDRQAVDQIEGHIRDSAILLSWAPRTPAVVAMQNRLAEGMLAHAQATDSASRREARAHLYELSQQADDIRKDEQKRLIDARAVAAARFRRSKDLA